MALRVAVVGAGYIGNQHMTAYASCEGAELVAVCDLIRDKAEAAATRFRAKSYTNLTEMLAKEQIDSLSVCTAGAQNGSHHFGPVMQCLAARRHVLCEKPLSNQLTEARAMVAKAADQGLYLGCDLNHRFTPQAALARQWIDEGRLGDVLLANVTLWIDNPNDRSPWVHLRALHPHSFDVMRYYCGRAMKVHAFCNRAPKADGPDGKRLCWSNVQVNVLFESGAIGHLTGSYDANMQVDFERCEVLGSNGRFVIDNCYERLTLYPRRSSDLTVVPNALFGGISNFEETITRRVQRWVEQVSEGAPASAVEASGADGLAVQEIIEAAITSWDENRIVDVMHG